MIDEKTYKEAKEIVKIYEEQLVHDKAMRIITSILSEGESFEYKDMMGNWYPYTEDLQNSRHFEPTKIRIKKL
jgi:hypothetical protein